MRVLVILFLSVGLSACALMDINQTHYTTKADGPGIQQWYAEKQQAKFSEAKGELGLAHVRELSEQEYNKIQQRMHLKQLESNLVARDEKAQYYSLKPHFKNDQERIEFLSQPNHIARQRWSDYRGIASIPTEFEPKIAEIIEKNDIAKGMSMEAVKQSWGEPDLREAAGNSMYQNQAWHYRKMISTDNGYKEERRVIFFESGRVAGWQTF